MKEGKQCSELLISLQKNQSRIKEETKKMWEHELSPSIYEYVLGLYKGKGKALGEIAAVARSFEDDLNCWIDMIEAMEGLER